MAWGRTSRGWTAVDVDDGPSICAVSVRTGVRPGELPQVLNAATLQRHEQPDETVALRDLRGRVDRRLPAVMTLARSNYRLRVMTEPVVPARDMASSLRWALSTEPDATLDDFNLSWMPIPADDGIAGRPRQVYTIQSPSAWLQERVALWRKAGMRPKVVDIRETALRNIAARLERPGEGLALLAVDTRGVSIVFCHQGALLLDRFIELPLGELRAADDATRARLHERIAVQLMRSIDVVSRSHPRAPVSRVLLAPEPEPTGLPEFLAAQLPLAVERVDLARVFDLARVPELARSQAQQARCLVALGATLRGLNGVRA